MPTHSATARWASGAAHGCVVPLHNDWTDTVNCAPTEELARCSCFSQSVSLHVSLLAFLSQRRGIVSVNEVYARRAPGVGADVHDAGEIIAIVPTNVDGMRTGSRTSSRGHHWCEGKSG